MKIKMPYSRGEMEINLPADNLRIYESGLYNLKSDKSQEEIIKEALINPIGMDRLSDLAENKKKAVIITSDHERAVPTKISMPLILEEIRRKNKDIDVTILIATGMHRGMNEAEMLDKFGPGIVKNEKIVNHNARNKEDLVRIGTLPSGGELAVNKIAAEADLIVSEGLIKPHPLAGFSGGRKSILPGIVGEKAVLASHCSEFLLNRFAYEGNLIANPLHIDMLYAAHKIGLDFVLNLICGKGQEIVQAFAGHYEASHIIACEYLKKYLHVQAEEADIVITSSGGYPIDQNLYQGCKGMETVKAICKKGGVIILIAACQDGHGGKTEFYNYFQEGDNPQEVYAKLAKCPKEETKAEQWAAMAICDTLRNFHVILVSDLCHKDVAKGMYINCVDSFDEALQIAYEIMGNGSKIAVIPDGCNILLELAN